MRDLKSLINNGESSFLEFKEDIDDSTAFSEEIVGFLNVKGGTVLAGVSDTGEIKGIEKARIKKIEEWIMNICRNNIVPPVIPIYETVKIDNK